MAIHNTSKTRFQPFSHIYHTQMTHNTCNLPFLSFNFHLYRFVALSTRLQPVEMKWPWAKISVLHLPLQVGREPKN